MNWTTVCRVSGLVVALGFAILMKLVWPHWGGYVPVAGILAGLILFGSTLRRPWVAVVLAWLGCAVGLLWLIDLVLFPTCRFDSVSIAAAVVGALCITYGLLGWLARPLSLILLLLSSSGLIVLIFLGVLVFANSGPRPPEIKDLPALVRATPEQAAAYMELVKLIPWDDQNAEPDPDRDAFNEAVAEVKEFNVVRGNISDDKPLLSRMQPFLNKYWSFRAANEPVPPSYGPDAPRMSLVLVRKSALEVCTIRSLLDDGNIKAAEERYVRALRGVSNSFTGAHTLTEHMVNTAIAKVFLDVLAANSDRFFLEPNSLHPGLDPETPIPDLDPADLKTGRFKRFSKMQEEVSLLTLLSSLPDRMNAATAQAYLAEAQWVSSAMSSLKNDLGDKTGKSGSILQRWCHPLQRASRARSFEWPFFDADEPRWYSEKVALAAVQATTVPARELSGLDKKLEAQLAQLGHNPLRNMTGRALLFVGTPSLSTAIWRNRLVQAEAAAASLAFQYRVFGSAVPAGTNPLDGNPLNARMRDGTFCVQFADETTAPSEIVGPDFGGEVCAKPM